MTDSIKSVDEKPSKPYPDFPLYPHASKRWAKKIRGKTHYFGHWRDWKAALDRYQYENDYLQVGKTPPPQNATALNVDDMVNTFLERREDDVASGELKYRTWLEYRRSGRKLIEQFGRTTTIESLTPNDFAKLRKDFAGRLGLVKMCSEIARCRVIFNFAYKNLMIEKPVSYGTSFKAPDAISLKRERLTKEPRLFTIDELVRIYAKADQQMRCFILLGLNCGFGNSDVGQLENKHLVEGWISFPRPKTLVDRACPLWPETIQAIEAVRQKAYDSPLLFITKYGQPWYRETGDNPLTEAFTKVLDACELRKVGRNFYALRHTFRTIADDTMDQVACDAIMGHSNSTMAKHYLHGKNAVRLQAVVDHVRAWALPMLECEVAK